MSDKSTDNFKRKNLDQNDPNASGKMKKSKLTKEESDAMPHLEVGTFDYCLKKLAAQRNYSPYAIPYEPDEYSANDLPELEQLRDRKSFKYAEDYNQYSTLQRGFMELYEKCSKMSSERDNIKVLPGRVNFKILGQNSAIMNFRMKIDKPFLKMMKIYADTEGVNRHELNFRYDGDVVRETDTPYSLRIREGDTIEVYQRMMGGGAKIAEIEAADSSTVI